MTAEEQFAVSLKEYLEKILLLSGESHRREHALEAERANEKFVDANRVREQINSERGTFQTKVEYAAAHKTLEIQMAAIERRQENLEGRIAGTAATIAIVLIVVQIVIGLLLHFAK